MNAAAYPTFPAGCYIHQLPSRAAGGNPRNPRSEPPLGTPARNPRTEPPHGTPARNPRTGGLPAPPFPLGRTFQALPGTLGVSLGVRRPILSPSQTSGSYLRPTTRSFIGMIALSVILMCSGHTSVQHLVMLQ